MIERIAAGVRRVLLAIAGNVSLFVTTAFFVTGLLIMGPSYWWREYVDMLERYVLIPWGMALCLLRLERSTKTRQKGVRWDLGVLFVLLAWIVVPFALRFGNTFNNSASWHNHTVIFFGVYALMTEESAQKREQLFDVAALLFSVCSLVLGAALLYCVVAVRKFGNEEFAFGVCNGMFLCANGHYNSTGMVTVCCALMAAAGACRFRSKPLRLLCILSAVMMSLVTVLTQSRTARYALIAAYAVMVFGEVLCTERIRRTAVRAAAAALAACVVAAAGYGGAAMLTDAAIAHYNSVERKGLLPVAAAEGPETGLTEEAAEADEPAQQTKTATEDAYEARAAADASFSGRTDIWRNLLRHWKENPKYLLIGHGVSKIGHLVTEGTIHEDRESVSIHNAYLQYAADYGLIAFVLLCVFFAIVAVPAWRVFAARGGQRRPGYGALCGIVAASFLSGLMESAPLSAMAPMNIMLFFSLALLYARGRDVENRG